VQYCEWKDGGKPVFETKAMPGIAEQESFLVCYFVVLNHLIIYMACLLFSGRESSVISREHFSRVAQRSP
jgi:hypothetical protein